MVKQQNCIFNPIQILFPVLAASMGFLVSEVAQAVPVQCYIGNGGSYQVCDLQQARDSWVVEWPDGDSTVITNYSNASGEWADIQHVNNRGGVYGGGTRYPSMHYEQGEWLCYHKLPGGRGAIDFCITTVH